MSTAENDTWPISNAKVADLLGVTESTIRGYQHRFASVLIEGDDYLRLDLGIPYSPTLNTVWTLKGAIKLAGFCKKRKAKVFLQEAGVAERERSHIESDTMDIIEAALKGLARCCRQYPVVGYRIDLYLPEYKIAIECDEHDHRSIPQWKEDYREKQIRNALGCQFIRFNPHAIKFNIGSVINTLFHMILSHTQKVSEPEREKPV